MTTRIANQKQHKQQTARTANKASTIYFWAIFLILNFLLFLPAFLFNSESTTFIPNLLKAPLFSPKFWQDLLLWRNNLDPFRLHAELTILLALWLFLPWIRYGRSRRLFTLLIAATYTLALLYAVYESLAISFYQVDPALYSQASLFFNGIEFLLNHLPYPLWIYGLGGIFFISGLAVVIFLLNILINRYQVSQTGRTSHIIFGLLTLLVILSLFFNHNRLSSPKSVVSSLTAKLWHNSQNSLALYRQVQELNHLPTASFYDYSGHKLLAKPNIYLIFVESYGSTLLKDPTFQADYQALLSGTQDQLNTAGWSATSTLSESPTWGGGSWMAYTSALFGLRIDNNPAYETLLEEYKDGGYPDLAYFLKSQGYRYIRASALTHELDAAEWQQYQDFYGTDSWLQYSDIDYHGRLYGWGPAPPDQFSLNKVREIIASESDQPFLLFFITQNSHYPWNDVPPLEKDWRALDDGQNNFAVIEENKSPQIRRENYIKAITYQLQFLTDFITSSADPDDLFILIGDHQPGWITNREIGFATPVHIISQDPGLLAGFQEFGFQPGMAINQNEPTMKHEGFYSLFLRAFLRHFDDGSKQPPPYTPNGLDYFPKP